METLEDGDGLLFTTLGCEPTRSVGDDRGGDDEDGNENALKSDGDPPDLAANDTGGAESIVDPVGEDDTNVEDGKINSDELTTGDCGRGLGLEDLQKREKKSKFNKKSQ